MSPPPPPSPWEVGKGRHTYDVQGVPKSCQSCCKCRQRGLGVKKSLDNVDVICAWPPGKESIRQVTWFSEWGSEREEGENAAPPIQESALKIGQKQDRIH